MYASPIEKIYGELQTQMVQEDENMVMKAVRKVGVNVDKEELIKALQYDRNQYTKGYSDGKSDVLGKIRAEIESCREDEVPHLCDYRYHRNEGLDMALDIIDKYKESED